MYVCQAPCRAIKECLGDNRRPTRLSRFKVWRMVGLRFLSRVWSAYQRHFAKNPWRTQTLTTGMIIQVIYILFFTIENVQLSLIDLMTLHKVNSFSIQ